MKKGIFGRGLILALALALVCLACWAQPVSAEPQGGTVTAGSAAIDQSMPGVTNITQFTDQLIINWEKYGIGLQELVRYLQPNDLAVALNRVTGVDPSVILGSLQANGRIFILNPNGILFGQQSKVDVGGLLATTLTLSDKDFLNGNYAFVQDPAKGLSFVVNKGQIKAADGGYVVLVAPLVNNEGTIIANLGHVVLAGGSKATVTFDAQGLVNFSLPASNEVTGNVVMTTEACADVLQQVVNQQGIVEAGEVLDQDGKVILVHAEGLAVNSGSIQANGAPGQDAGSVLVHSTQATVLTPTSDLEARGIGENSNGGLIETSTYRNIVFNGEVDASAEQGHGGTWTLDPTDVTIQASAGSLDPGAAGNFIPLGLGPVDTISTGAINNFLTAGTSVNIVTTSIAGGNGDITVNSAITPGTGNIPVSLTLTAERNIAVNAAIDGSGLLNSLDVILAATGNVYVVAPVTTNGGSFSSSGVVFNNTGGAITTGNGNITLMHTGNITLGADLNAGAGTVALSTTAGGISQTGGAITGFSLGVRAANAVDLNLDANDVASMAGQVTGAVQAFSYRDANAVSIDYASTLNGIVTNNGAIAVTTVSGDLTVNNTPYPDVDAGSAQVNLTAGGAESRLTVTGSVRGTGGVTYTADDMELTGATDAGTNDANLLQTTINRPIDLGTDTTGSLGLTNDELNTITAGVLRIGDGNSGNITISAPISPSQIPTLSLQTGGTITQPGGAVAITVTNLAVSSAGTTSLMNTSNNVTNLAGQVTGAGQAFYYEDADGLSIGTVGTMNGIHTNNAAILIGTLNGNLTVDDTPAANDVDSGTGNIGLTAGGSGCLLTVAGNVHGTGGVEYKADDIALSGTTITGVSGASLYQSTNGRQIDLGTNTAETLGLTNVELQTITGGTLRVGSNGGGNITISAPIFSLNATTLVLGNSGGTSAISQNSGAMISVTNLRLSSAGPVTLNEANHVGKLAAEISGAGNAFSFTNADALNVGTVYSVNGITTNNGAVNLTTGDTLTLSQNLSAGTGTVTLNSSAGGVNQTGGSLTAGNLDIAGTGTFTLNQAANNVGTLAADVVGDLSYTDVDSISVGSVSNAGIQTHGGSLTLNSAGITQNVGCPINTGGGFFTADAGTGTYIANSSINTTGSGGYISITATGINFMVGAGSVSGTSTILLQPSADASDIGIGDGVSGAFLLESSDIAALADGFTSITIGRATGQHDIHINAVSFNDPVTIQTPNGGSIAVNGTITCADNASVYLDGPGATTTLNADIVTAGTPINISDNVLIGAASVLLDTTNGGNLPTGAGITVTGTTDSAGAAGNSLTLNAGTGGNIALNGAVGNNNMLNVLTVTNSNSATFGSSLTSNTVVLTNTTAGHSITFSAAATIGTLTTATHGYNVVFNGGGTMTTDATFLNTGTVTLGNNAGDAITFTGGLDTTACGGTNIAGTVNTTNADMGFGPVTLTADTVLDTGPGSGNITLAGAVTGGGCGLQLISGYGTTTANGALNNIGVLTLQENQVSSTGSVTFNGDLTACSVATFGQAYDVSFLGSVTNVTGDPTFYNTGSVTLGNGGDTLTFGDGLAILASSNITIGGTVNTTNTNIDLGSPITLIAGSVLNTEGGDITFSNTLDGGFNLGLTAGTGNVVLTGAVGGGIRLGAITINSADTVNSATVTAESFTQTAGTGSTTIAGINTQGLCDQAGGAVNVTTNGDITIGPINSQGGMPISGGGNGGTVILNGGNVSVGTIDASGSGSGNGGTINLVAGSGSNPFITLNGNVTASGASGGTIALQGPSLLTTSVNLNVVALGGMGAGGHITLNGSLNGTAGGADENLSLLAGSGSIMFTGAVGDVTRLGALTINSANDVTADAINAASIAQIAGTGTTVFNGPLNTNDAAGIALTGNNFTINNTVTTTGGGPVTITNAGSLPIAAVGDMTLDGAFLQNGAGLVNLAGDINTTNDNITFNSAATLSGPVVFNAGMGTVVLQGVTCDPHDLNIIADGIDFNGGTGSITGTGHVNLMPSADAVGIGIAGGAGTLQLTAADIQSLADGFNRITIGSATGWHVITINAITFTDPVLIRTPDGGSITVNGQITGSGNASVTLDGLGFTTTLNADIVTAGNPITINDSVLLGSPAVVTLNTANGVSAGADISITGTVNDAGTASALVLNAGAGGFVTLGGFVGDTTPIASLTTTGAINNILCVTTSGAQAYNGAVNLNGDLISEDSGAITFAGPVLLQGEWMVQTSGEAGADIRFSSTLDGAFPLYIDAGLGDILLDGAVGGTIPLTNLGMGSAYNVNLPAINISGELSQGSGIGPTTFNGPVVSGGEVYMNCGSVVFAGTSNIIAGGGNGIVSLNALFGSIVSGSAAADIRAGELSLSSDSGIGVPNNPLATAVHDLDAECEGSSGIFIANSGDLNLRNLGGSTEAIYSNGGAVEISAASMITISDPVATNGGNLALTATAGITQLGAINIDTTADTGTPAGSYTAIAGAGSYTMNSGALIQTSDSDGSGNIQIAAASIGIGEMNAGSDGSVNLTASSGSILANLVTGVNVAARNLTLAASNNIGTSLNPVLTKVENLTALAPSGSLFVSEYEAINLLDVRAGIDISITCAAGNMVLTAVKADRDVYLTALDGFITGEISKISAQNIILTMSAGGAVEPITPGPIITGVETAPSPSLNSETYLRVLSDISNPWQANSPDFFTWMLLNKLVTRTEQVLYVTPPAKETPSPISSL
ncbi:MAG: filamentous hemagglutinin N-terminal domain-containing protein [bacterium]